MSFWKYFGNNLKVIWKFLPRIWNPFGNVFQCSKWWFGNSKSKLQIVIWNLLAQLRSYTHGDLSIITFVVKYWIKNMYSTIYGIHFNLSIKISKGYFVQRNLLLVQDSLRRKYFWTEIIITLVYTHVFLFVCQSYDKERPDLHCSLLLNVNEVKD